MVKAIPDDYPQVIPYLSVEGADKAIEFYGAVLGAKERVRMDAPGGKIGHTELEIGRGLVMLADTFPDMGAKSPNELNGSPVTVMVYVEDVDKVFTTAVEQGAQVLSEPSDQFYGDRSASFVDPFGHRWHVSTHIEDVPDDEMRRRAAAAMGG